MQLVELFKKSQTAYGADQADIADVSRTRTSERGIHADCSLSLPLPRLNALLAAQRLDTLSNIPDYANYLVFTLTSLTSEEPSVRSVAGLILKNHLFYNREKVSQDSLQYIKMTILPALSMPEDLLRRTATQVMTMLMAIQGPANWPEGLIKLTELMGSQNINEAEVSPTGGCILW